MSTESEIDGQIDSRQQRWKLAANGDCIVALVALLSIVINSIIRLQCCSFPEAILSAQQFSVADRPLQRTWDE